MKVGLFGGSFDPIHKGHLKLALAALRQLKLDRVYLIVSPLSPFKTDRPLASPSLRFRMVRAAIRGEKGLRAADWELKRKGPSYTVRTVTDRARKNPKDDLFLILGSDALKGFPRWRNPTGILKRAALVGGRRPGAAWPRLPSLFRERLVKLRGTFPDVSSTEIRAALKSGKRPRLVTPAVLAVINREGLYRDR